jgi:hypothetical protein
VSIPDFTKVPDDELERIIRTEAPHFNAATHEWQKRQLESTIARLSKPHWTQTSGFWVAVAAMLFAALAAYFSYLSIPQSRQTSDVNRSTQTDLSTVPPQQLQSQPMSPFECQNSAFSTRASCQSRSDGCSGGPASLTLEVGASYAREKRRMTAFISAHRTTYGTRGLITLTTSEKLLLSSVAFSVRERS